MAVGALIGYERLCLQLPRLDQPSLGGMPCGLSFLGGMRISGFGGMGTASPFEGIFG